MKSLPVKRFKGCVKIPIRTDLSEQELLKQSVWLGHWKTHGKYILAKRRRYYINLYLFNSLGQKEVLLIHSPNKLDMYQMKPLMEYALEQIKVYTDIDFNKSYMTVSC